MGLAYASKNMTEDAITQFKKTVGADPTNTNALYNLAYAYEEKGMIDEAITEYKKAIKVNSDVQGQNKKSVDTQDDPEKVIVTK